MSTSRLTRATSGTVLSDNVYMTPSVFSPAAETTSSGVPSFSPGSSPFNHLEISPYGDSTIYRYVKIDWRLCTLLGAPNAPVWCVCSDWPVFFLCAAQNLIYHNSDD